MATLTIKNVQKRYGNVSVLKGIDLELTDGEFLVLLGPSGCGKSTLLNMIAGLDTITDGSIQIDGRIINDVHPKDRDIAMVFQSYALYPNMNVARNIAFGLEMRGVDKPGREVAVKKVAALLQMEHLLDRKPAQLSGGQRQRVAMGRALVRDPKVFLFDEPLSNLDAKLRVDMRTEIKKLHQRLGTTIVYVTHDQIEAMTLATRIAIMKEGVVQQFAPPQEVYEQPANMYVAGFIGSPAMNFIPAQVVSEADRVGVRITGAQGSSVLPLPAPSAAVLNKVGQEVILGVRPETIARYQHGTNLPPNFARFSAQVSVTEPTGADTLTYLALGGRDAIARVPPKEAPTAGEVAEFTVDMARACLFDPKTEQRVG
ncbi:sugar ABC transporter ATP-binding protein [Elstera cyanobacteriorum]|uniref:Sugar ABC transporter ATP-binding protein n=1 Tax=Elstera cyanobacteriorum TaxID=2022747 RepID=A0A255XW84_9PROT|nr:sn-glycerol-3-phosphate ABC transporter ATP-binding protein UgpC [Elstera cyanobacteriorum]OYQ21141.1 sugar ABC transporter ATP-binding protein [Elstera cyanobacteriorum]GGA03327.1 sugar ABC transporter ATP-binding protein [Elstera cyanobacteriorum]